jgi:hypothetical protein
MNAQNADTVRMDDALAELVAAAREMLLPIEHDGPCINYDGQYPEWYDEYDSCSRHLAAAADRKARLAAAIARIDGSM